MLQALCVPSLARALGWAGIIPFVALSLSAVFTIGSISQKWAMDALALYGAVILSFLGGAVWGLTLGHEGEALRPGAQGLLIGIAASLAGFGGALTLDRRKRRRCANDARRRFAFGDSPWHGYVRHIPFYKLRA